MVSFSLRQIELNKSYGDLGIVKKFYVKLDDTIDRSKCKFTLLCGGDIVGKTSKLVYDQSHQMWEIKFYSRIVNLCDLPPELRDCLLFNVAKHHTVRICSKINCDLFVETCDLDVPIVFDTSMETYVEYTDCSWSGSKNNLLRYCSGMMGSAYKTLPLKYSGDDIIDVFDEQHCGREYNQSIKKYSNISNP
jgi:hypothetical protein|uniref:Uncharacterized protein n=1 Tax=viral metagenome TaxID=1070528 RepID=A0A6C0BJR4_9ZZZZ